MEKAVNRFIVTRVVIDEVIPDYIMSACRDFWNDNRKISAIKLFRGYMNRNDSNMYGVEHTCGLKEAKDFVEQNVSRW